VLYYHIGVGPDLQDKYEAEKLAFVRNLVEQMGDVQPDNATIMKFASNSDWMSAISGVFVGNCAQCHANDGGGNIGPNMTDDNYKNIKEPADFFKVISNGVPGTAMVGKSNQFSPQEIILLSAYVASLRGTTPANPKAPEGATIAPWPTPAAEGAEAGESNAKSNRGT
jgi:cytochrome c oxidase cbb3-type subunit 3